MTVSDTARGPLVGLRVVDIASVYAAPFAASLLADFGADVLKVELPGSGDPLRGMEPTEDGESLVWAALSRNKRAITLDLRTERGQELLLRIIAEQDVLVENFRPGTLERWGLGVERLREANSRLIVVRVSGFGQTGPYREKAGFGTPSTAFSGYTALSGFPDGPPLSPPISLTDYVAGLFAALGALAALYHRDALGGVAQEVDVALYEAMFRLLENVVTPYDRLGVTRQRSGNALPSSAPVGTYRSGDDRWMVLTTSTERPFRRLADLMGRPDLKTDPRYATNRARVQHRDALDEIVVDWFGRHDAVDIQRWCDAAGVPVSPVYTIADIFADPQYAAREAIVAVEHPTLGEIKVPGIVPKFSATPGTLRSAGQPLGGQNREVYRALGLLEEELDRLEKEGVI